MVAPATVSSAPVRSDDAVSLAVLHESLRDELDGQRQQVETLATTVRELTGANDPESVHARDVAERSMNLALDVIDEVEHALARIAAGTYGSCEACGGAVALPRLEVLPYTRHCVSCPPPAPLPRRL